MQLATLEQNYDAQIAAMRHSPFMDYPSHVHLETLARCNAACNFCPYPTISRKGTKMSDDLIQKVITDLMDVPDDVSFMISPFKVSEPFLEKRLFDVMRLINSSLPNATIALTSNASPLTEAKLEELQSIERIAYLWISFNDHRSKSYEETMQLPFKRTINRLDLLHDWKKHGRLPFRVVLSRVGDGTSIDREFPMWVKQHYPSFESNVFERGGWLGQADVDVGEVPNIGCVRWFDISITATGKVAHCCMDGDAKWPIGDVTEQHVLEVYNSPDYRSLRERTVSRLHVEPCNTCTFR